jgi:hypothetical protein
MKRINVLHAHWQFTTMPECQLPSVLAIVYGYGAPSVASAVACLLHSCCTKRLHKVGFCDQPESMHGLGSVLNPFSCLLALKQAAGTKLGFALGAREASVCLHMHVNNSKATRAISTPKTCLLHQSIACMRARMQRVSTRHTRTQMKQAIARCLALTAR